MLNEPQSFFRTRSAVNCAAVTMLICLSERGGLIGLYVSFLLGSNLKIAGLHFVLNILINFSTTVFHFLLLIWANVHDTIGALI